MADAAIEASHASSAAPEPEPSRLPTVSLDKPPASAGAKPAAQNGLNTNPQRNEKMRTILLSLSAAMLAFPLMTQAAAPVHHDHGDGAAPAIELNAGKKWATDDALRQGMSAIRTLAAKALPDAHAGKLKPAAYDALAKDINSHIAYIVGNCKLDPKADAQLHIVIGELAGGIDTMKGKQPGQARAMGVVNVSQTLNTYGKYFNHPGWRAIKLPH